MFRRLLPLATCFALTIPLVLAQNSNSSTTVRTRGAATNTNTARPSTKSTDTAKPSTTAAAARTSTPKPAVAATSASASTGVTSAFNKLIEGIRHSDVSAVTSAYLNSPRLTLFNNNGSVTKGWEQLRKNRQSSYPEVKDVKLETRDLSVTMLGRDAAVVTCLWNQSQTYKGTPEEASGRMTAVFKRVGNDWKIIHLHTSSDKPPTTNVMPSEQQSPAPSPSPSATPTP